MRLVQRCALLGAVASFALAAGVGAQSTTASSDTVLLARLRAHFDTSNAVVTRYRNGVAVHRDSLRAAPGISAKQLDNALHSATVEILNGIPGSELQPLRDFVSARAPSSADAILVACAFEGGECLSESAADSLWSRFTKVIGAARPKNPGLQVDIDVETKPNGAKVELLRKDGQRERVGFAKTAFRVYRGLYDYRVTLNGYQSLTSELDLVEDPGTRLVCTLARASDQTQFTVCRLEKPPTSPNR
jgi:hypothetical protein